MQQKRRRDAGLILVTERDLYCVQWIAEMEAVRVDQLSRVILHFVHQQDFCSLAGCLAETTIRALVGRWEAAAR